MKATILQLLFMCLPICIVAQFEDIQEIESGSWRNNIEVADFNGDLYPDLLVGNRYDQYLTIYYNDGNGNFIDSTNIELDGYNLRNFVISNINYDEFLDIVGVDYGSNLVLITNNAGVFHDTSVAITGAENISKIVTGEFDGLGGLDIILYGSSSPSSIYLYRIPDSWNEIYVKSDLNNIDKLIISKFDNNDFRDAVFTEADDQEMSYKLYLSSWQANKSNVLATYSFSDRILDFAVEDVNGDNINDIVTIQNDGLVSVLLFNSSKKIDSIFPVDTIDASLDSQVRISRNRTDGFSDLFVTDRHNIYLYQYTDFNDKFEKTKINDDMLYPTEIVIKDLNGDRYEDIVVLNGFDGLDERVVKFENIGSQFISSEKPVLCLPFNDDVNDESEFSHTVTPNHAVVFTEDRFGNENSAYLLNSYEQNLKVAANSVFDIMSSDGFTLSLWYKGGTQDVGDYELMFAMGSHKLSLYDVNQPNFAPGFCWDRSAVGFYPDTMTWHHLVVIRHGENIGMYRDNAEMIRCSGFAASEEYEMDDIVIGGSFKGALDDITLYNRALTIDELEALIGTSGYQCAIVNNDSVSVDVFEKEIDEISYRVYPIPFRDNFRLSLGQLEILDQFKFELFDVTGKQVSIDYQIENSEVSFETSYLTKGFYVLNIQNTGDSKSNTIKLIKH